MDITINDDQFIDLINDTTSHLQDEINDVESRIDDLESSGYATQDDLDDLDTGLTNRMEDLEGEVHQFDERCEELDSRIDDLENYDTPSDAVTQLTEKIYELEYEIEQLQSAIGGLHKRTNWLISRTLRNRIKRARVAVTSFITRINWHSPFLNR